jgi:SAM-dependent methyltransferase
MSARTQRDLKQVQEHYMDYPYPFRDPEDEKTRLLSLMGESLGEINHWCFGGKKDFKKGFRMLVAGGGTGDCSTYMGEQLKGTESEIVYLDFSKNSMEIAKRRAEIRGIKNITWINDSIFNIPNLKLGKFDFINCSGVLHHLPSPDDGLKILADSLNDDGAANIMVYGLYGRTGVYQIQEIMKMVNHDVENRIEEVMNAKSIISALPDTNWFQRGRELITDHIHFGDIGIYDLFLHKQDRAYSIPQFHEFANKAGLHFVQFSDLTERMTLRIENYIKDFSLLQKIKKMDIVKQQAICELIAGNVIKHTAYLTKSKKNVSASFEDTDNVPFFYAVANVAANAYKYINENPSAPVITITLNTSWLKNVAINIKVNAFTKHIFNHMSGKPKSIKEMFDGAKKDMKSDFSEKVFVDEVKATLSPLVDVGVLLLANKSVKIG